MNISKHLFQGILVALSVVYHSCSGQQVAHAPSQLTCEYITNPTGIDVARPSLAWVVPNKPRGNRQTAYQILVAHSETLLASDSADVWDSGKMVSEENVNLLYNGRPLQSFKQYFWKVRYWNAEGEPSAYSALATFTTAMMDSSNWTARWIGDGRQAPDTPEEFYEKIPNTLLRKSFDIAERPVRAELYITGLGYFEAYINGQKVGNDVLHPGWTQYAKRVLYTTYNVSEMLENGENAVGVMLGNGWYNPLPLALFRRFNMREFLTIGQPKCIAQLRLEYADGEVEWIKTDETWKTSEGPILKNNIYLGEYYDARREQPGWNGPGFDDGDWKNAAMAEPPAGTLRAQMTPPNRVTAVLKPVAMQRPEPDVVVYDFGQNFAGWIRLRLSGPRGEAVNIRYGELLYDSGRVNGMTTVAGHIKEAWNLSGGPGAPKTAYQEDTYILKGGGEEIFQQRFTFHGFRYIEVTGHTSALSLESVEGLRISADLEKTGFFTSSDSLLNTIQEMTEWTFLSNVFSIQSDCPAREKFGYGGDIVTAGESYIFNYNMANFYKKTVRDFADDARPNGGLPETAPYNGIDTEGFGQGTGPIGWQLAHPFVLEKIYEHYGDSAFVADQYPVVVRLIEFLQGEAINNLIYHGIGDHVAIDPKPDSLTSGAFYYHIVKLGARFAEILHKPAEQTKYEALAKDIKEAFIQTYLQRGTGKLTKAPNQITQVFGLYYDLLPDGERLLAFDVLAEQILEKHQGHIATGIFGTKMMFDVLRQYGRNDIAYTLTTQRDYPGYGYMIANGATTLWEHWDKSRNQNSKNHPMFGSVSEWFFRALGGINPASQSRAFDPLVIKPQPVDKLQFVKTTHKSLRGPIVSNWEQTASGMKMEVVIPGNTTALIHVPITEKSVVKESGALVYDKGTTEEIDGLHWRGENAGYAVWEAAGGSYHFEINSAP
jgi:alpha-L-rhamnosidase